MKWILRSVVILLLSFFVCFGILGLYSLSLNPADGESVGEGWYLLKNNEVNYEVVDGQEKMVSSSQEVGSGPINISIIVSISLTLVYLMAALIKEKAAKPYI